MAGTISRADLQAAIRAALEDVFGAPPAPAEPAWDGASEAIADGILDAFTSQIDDGDYIRRDGTDLIGDTGGGGGGGAPTNAPYVVVAPHGSLTNYRVITAGSGISIIDGGPTGDIEIHSNVTQYTDEQVRDVIGLALTGSGAVTITADDPGNTIDIGAPFGLNAVDSQSFAASGNWITPAGFTPTWLRVIAYGGGGGGGGGFSAGASAGTGGGGGGGGARREVWLRYADVLAAYPLAASTGVPVTIGAGGIAGVGRTATTIETGAPVPGGVGGTTSFGTLVRAYGGGGSTCTGSSVCGGSGAGSMGPGITATSGSTVLGGLPHGGPVSGHTGGAFGDGGGYAYANTTLASMGCADEGGGAGGFSNSTAAAIIGPGMAAVGGGGGGGAGGGHSSAPTVNQPTDGGGTGQIAAAGGGGGPAGASTAVGSPTPGTAGTDGSREHGGTGGGGGGASAGTAGTDGAAGGAGGTHGGGGGGGGCARCNPAAATGGPGGVGGRGHLYVDAF